MTDYRLKILEFLENQPDMKGNILPLVFEYLKETERENRTSFEVFLRPLKDKKFIIIYPEAEMGLNVRSGGVYVHDNIQVRMTYEGLDYLEELRKKNSPPTQQPTHITMNISEETEHAMLNFFRLMGLQSEEDLYIDLRRSGVGEYYSSTEKLLRVFAIT